MLLADAETLALRLMSKHGLIDDGWTMRFSGIRVKLGRASRIPKLLTFSRSFALSAPEDDFEQIVLHEIAHALRYAMDAPDLMNDAHDEHWMAAAVSIGYKYGRQAPKHILDYYRPFNKKRERKGVPLLIPGDVADWPWAGSASVIVIRVLKHEYLVHKRDGYFGLAGFGMLEKTGQLTPDELAALITPRLSIGDTFRTRFGVDDHRTVRVININRTRYTVLDENDGSFDVYFFTAHEEYEEVSPPPSPAHAFAGSPRIGRT